MRNILSTTFKSRFQLLKSSLKFIALAFAAWLFFTVWRARRLLANSRVIAIQSATFPRSYTLGSGPEITYLAMGDSTAAGWGAGDFRSTYPHQIARALAARGFRVHLLNVAVGGATLADVRREQSAALRTIKPDLVTLSIGANDATHRTPDADFGSEMWALRLDLSNSSARAVLIANVPNMFWAPALPLPAAVLCGQRARALNAILASFPTEPKIHDIDLFGRGMLDFQRDPGLFAADLFHPSGRGYEVWAQLFIEKLDSSTTEKWRKNSDF